MRLLVALNEAEAGAHADVHTALHDLRAAGVLEDSRVYPFLAELRSGKTAREIGERIREVAREFRPTAILWSHVDTLTLPEELIAKLRGLPSHPVVGYWDGDWYEPPFKPVPRPMVALARQCDVVFCQGKGYVTDLLRRKGCRTVRYVPAPMDPQRFHPAQDPLEANREFDVVLIGNYISSRLPWRTFPGSRWRKDLVELLHRNLGHRLAVFGSGWPSAVSRGVLPFEKQSHAYYRGRLAVGINNLHAAYYFSNRLPIAMSSGVPVVYNSEEGFGELFAGCEGISFFRTTEEAWKVISRLLQKDQQELDSLGEKASSFAMRKFPITQILTYMIEVLRSSWLNGHSVSPAREPENPWLVGVHP